MKYLLEERGTARYKAYYVVEADDAVHAQQLHALGETQFLTEEIVSYLDGDLVAVEEN